MLVRAVCNLIYLVSTFLGVQIWVQAGRLPYHLQANPNVGLPGFELESVCFKSQQEQTRNTPAGEMWGRALRLSAPTPQVYDITHTSAQGNLAQPVAASAEAQNIGSFLVIISFHLV